MYACLAVTCHLHFWQNDLGLLRATAVTRGWNGYRNKSQHRKSTLEKKILPPFQQGFEPATFQSRVRCSNHWAIPAPKFGIGLSLSLICQPTSEDIKQHYLPISSSLSLRSLMVFVDVKQHWNGRRKRKKKRGGGGGGGGEEKREKKKKEKKRKRKNGKKEKKVRKKKKKKKEKERRKKRKKEERKKEKKEKKKRKERKKGRKKKRGGEQTNKQQQQQKAGGGGGGGGGIRGGREKNKIKKQQHHHQKI